MARTVYVTTELTGGGSGLDGIDGDNLTKGNLAFYISKDSSAPKHEGGYSGIYMATTRGSTVEDSPRIIRPDSNTTGWNWELLAPIVPFFHTTGRAQTLAPYGVNVIRTTAASVHQLKRPRRGARVRLVFATTSVVKVRLTTAVAGSLATPTVTIAKVGLVANTSACVIITPTSRALTEIPPSIELTGRSTARWEVTGYTNVSTGTSKRNLSYSTTT